MVYGSTSGDSQIIADIKRFSEFSTFITDEKRVGWGHKLTFDDLEFFFEPYTEISPDRLEDLLHKDVIEASTKCIKQYSRDFLTFSEPRQRGLVELAFLDEKFFQQNLPFGAAVAFLTDNDTWNNNKAWRAHIGELLNEV